MRNPHHKKVGAPSVESSHFDKPGQRERERKKGKGNRMDKEQQRIHRIVQRGGQKKREVDRKRQKQSFDMKEEEGEKNRSYALSEQTPLLINTAVNV